MRKCNLKKWFAVSIVSLPALLSGGTAVMAYNEDISRYKTDFWYMGIGYQILSEADRTVAVTQDFDIDHAESPEVQVRPSFSSNSMMEHGYWGMVVNIPQTVYDESGNAYTVTTLAYQALDYLGIGALILPPTLESLNDGIGMIMGMTTLYLPAGLKEIEGIVCCKELESLYIPGSVETVKNGSLRACGLDIAYLPPSVKSIENEVLSYCDNLKTAMTPGLETMGESCFKGCDTFIWANLPETLRHMGDGCFNDCVALEVVSLPGTEIEMNNCFNVCPSVECIEVSAVEPYPFPSTSFKDVDRSKCLLSVPEGSVEKYRNAEGWKEFYNIEGNLPSGVDTIESAGLPTAFRAVGGEGFVTIVNPSGLPLDIVSFEGQKMASTHTEGVSRIDLPEGIYVVASKSGSSKVVVK